VLSTWPDGLQVVKENFTMYGNRRSTSQQDGIGKTIAKKAPVTAGEFVFETDLKEHY